MSRHPVATRHLIIALAVLAVLWPAERPSAADSLSPSRWRVVEFAGAQSGQVETLDITDGTASGKAGCNRFFAPYTLDAGKLTFGPVSETRMHCGP